MLRHFTLLIWLCLFSAVAAAQSEQELYHLASYETGIEGSAEVVAFDPATHHAFFTSNGPNTLTVISLTNPSLPTLIAEISLADYGGGPNSVAVSNGLVAVAVQADPKTDPGKVVFFDADGNYLHQVTVGALPDMIAFSPDGAKVLTANEGEPNNDYTIDPLGSVSVVDISGEITSATVQTITFESYNDKKIHLQNKGIRIFGNNGLASVAEDMEPEYIAFSPDGLYAYVNCQENNGLAVLDLETLEIADIFPLGYKAHQSGRPKLESFIVNELAAGWPELGAPVYDGGQDPVMLGGFSGMYYDPTQSTVNSYVFYVVPDRGPNDDTFGRNNVTPPAPQNLRPFKLPDYQGRIVKFTINRQTGAVTLNDQVLLYRQDGVTPISGKGNIPGFDEVPVTYTDPNTPYTNVDFVDNDSGEELHQLPYDEFGGDFEGILRDKEGNFWMCDEYRPALYKFQPNGVLIERFVPEGTSLLGTTPQPAGTYGAETLPAVYAKRRANRGFEAIAYNPETNVVYAFIQSPIENPDNSVRNNTDVIRILGVDAEDGTPVEEYVYLLERNQYAGLAASRVDKIGDAVFIGNDKFLVLERDSEGPGVSEGKKYVFEVDLKGARNIIDTELSKRNGFTLEEVALLNRSASVTDEANTPFLLPAEFSQSLIIDRNTANEDSDFAATFGNWDMIALDPANQFIYIPHEVETGAGLTRYDRGSGDFVAALTGDNSGNFEADPSWKACPSEDFGALDPAQWTPAGTVLTAEEWSGNGRMFEWMNPLMGADEKPEVRWLSTIPSVSHEGLKFDADGNMYFIDENNSGSIYKFVPKVANDYSRGQSFVLVIDAYAGNPAANWDDASNTGAARTGAASWVAITDENGKPLTAADPFDYGNRGGRLAADEVNGTPYGRPEDLEIVDKMLFLAVTSEQMVLSIELVSESSAMVRVFASRSTLDSANGVPVGEALASPDNLASDADGTIYIVEDQNPGDIWVTVDADHDGVAESMARWASLGVEGSEPTGLIPTSNPRKFIVSIQHPSSGNDALWEITVDPSVTTMLTASATVTDEANAPFLLPDGFTQTLIVDRNTANEDSDFVATFGNWDMIALDPSEQFIYIPHEVGTGAGLTRYDRTTGDFVTAMTGDNSGNFVTKPSWRPCNGGDFGALDPAEWTPASTIMAGEEWSGNGRMFEWMNPLMGADEEAEVRWLSGIPSVSHEGLKFDASGNMYFVDENNSGSVYKFVPKTAGDYSKGQTFVLSVDAFAGNPAANWDDASNTGAARTGAASWVAITDEDGYALTTADPFDYSNRGGRLAADEVNGTPYGRPEDLEIVGDMLYLSVTSEHSVLSIELLDETSAMVRVFASRATTDSANGTEAGDALTSPDNLASDAKGTIYIIEDQNPGDIWKTVDADHDGVAESMARWASLGVEGSEPTGLIATNEPGKFIVSIQHPTSGNDALWEITAMDSVAVMSNLPTLEQHSADELMAAGIQAVHKTKVANLPSLDYVSSDKSEGIALLPGGEIAVINDNDFGLAGAGVTDNSVLGIISFEGDYGFDASNEDGAINITSHPTLGMFLPDAIAAYEAEGNSYIVTANEGDSRDYDGYSEEVRVKDLVLDPIAYPNADELQADENLGRLKTTTANGDYDGDGMVDQIYSYGGRSFSIFDAYGNLVYDSGEDFGRITSVIEPALFNEDEGEKDGRSDDKGVEPEALAIGTIGDFTYAFVGFERQSAIVVYDITDPRSPEFITYYNNRSVTADGIAGDVAPEIIKFIPAEESPNGENLLVVGYEVSGSVGVIQVGGELVSISEELQEETAFKAFPNPTVDQLYFDQPVSGMVFDANGKFMTALQNTAELNVNDWPAGMYIIATEKFGKRRFLKL